MVHLLAMSVVAWIVLGLALGSGIGWFLGTRGRGLLATVVASTLGAVLGGFLASALVGLDVVDINPASMAVALLGALALIGVLQATPDTIFD